MIETGLSAETIKTEWQENPRLRLGVMAILVLFLSWVSLVWSDFNLEQYKQLRSLEREKISLQEIESGEVWQQRVADASSRLARLEKRVWQAETDGLAMAMLQSEIRRLLVIDDFATSSIKVGTPQPVEDMNEILRVRARVGLSVTPEQLMQSLTRVQNSDKRIFVEQLSLKKVRGRWSVQLMVAAYFSVPGDAA